jgi:hypothetical protein
MSGLFLLGGLGSVVVLFFPVILVLALLVILALRHDDDADGNRAPAIYGSVIAYVGVLTVLFSATGVVASLVELTNDSGDHDGTVTSGVIFLIAGVAALGLLRVHQGLFARRHAVDGAARRVHRAYVLVLCLTVALTAMVAGAIVLFQLYGAAFPDTAGTDRGDALRVLVTMAVLFAGAAVLWQRHWAELELGGRAPEVSAAGTP